ncbi:MAG: 1,5-anhydro-D-fructose reductase [Paracidovorax wautersii]|uniref:1,5-anhydro-D-fructose reductase n=1 Tax=Paracidovorax wautersii TaxID=1177982 RepID=A0A7V8JR31_9BURK|nr:MAG: 1,5-anhydro-D-fructose reductase [Paracidovorax wautersii]
MSTPTASKAARPRLAVIGAGAIGRLRIDRMGQRDDLALAAVVEPSDSGRAWAQALGVPVYADPETMLEAVRPDGAIVATPNDMHVDVAIACLRRGVAALVEKPVADTLDDARRLLAAEREHGRPVLIGHHRRHNPILRRAREIVASGRLGRLLSATALATFLKPDAYFDMAWRRQEGGGPILINLIHDIDLLRFLLGDIASIQAFSAHEARGFEVEDTAAALLRFKSGALATLSVSDATTAPWNWDPSGEAAHYPRQHINSHYISGTQGSLTLPLLEIWTYAGARG